MLRQVVALEGANTSAGSLVLQGGRVIWRQLGGRLSARNAKATCSGVAVQAQAAGKSSASPLPPSPPIHNLGMDQYQVMAAFSGGQGGPFKHSDSKFHGCESTRCISSAADIS